MLDFPKQYQPLFQLLTCRTELANLKMLMDKLHPKQVTLEMVEYLKYLEALSQVDTVLISGGRESGKTFGLGCFNVVATSDHEHRILYTRQTMSSTNNSITQALENRMELLGVFDDYTYANNDYFNKTGKGKISITGQKTSVGAQTAKLKSIEDYSIFETDEGEELTDYESWLKIKRSIRAKDVQCLSIISFNPPSKRHWLYTEFYLGVPVGFNGIIGHTLYVHTTYLDLGQEKMAEHTWREYEALRLQYEKYEALTAEEKLAVPRSARLYKDWREYRTSILGGFRDVAEGVIFDYSIGEFEEQEYGSTYGLDAGFTHATSCIKVSICKKRRKIWLKQILYKTGMTSSGIVKALKEAGVEFTRIWVDDAAATLIADLKEANLNAKGAKKPKIKDRINAALDYEIIIDPESKELMEEMDEYRWADNKTKEQPVDENNHACDAWGYAFYRMVKTRYAESGSH